MSMHRADTSEQNDIYQSGDQIEKKSPKCAVETKSDLHSLEDEIEVVKSKEISGFRTVLPQVLAVTVINILLMDLGMVLAFPTIIIPDLLKSTDSMKFTEEQASWFGSVAFLCQPLGSLFSGFLLEPLGRRNTMCYVNIPLLVGWLLIVFSRTIDYLYAGVVVMGIGIGFVGAPHITYLGEIAQPKWRGILTSYAELSVALGFCFVYFMGTSANWRTVSTICSTVPVITMTLITRIPESPIWLLSKGLEKQAQDGLCWLRGWVKPDYVRQEFSDLVRHNNATFKEKENCREETHPSSQRTAGKGFCRKIGLDSICRKSVIQPLFLVIGYFAFSHVAGVTSTRPFMVDIFEEFGSPLDAKWITVISFCLFLALYVFIPTFGETGLLLQAISSVIGIVGCICGMILLPRTGKRLLSLISMFGCATICSLLAIYGFFFSNFNRSVFSVSLFVALNFLWSAGIGQIPWMLISEVFPFKGRGFASGISAAFSYILAFVFTKTYYATYNAFTLPGVFALYAGCTYCGVLFLYYYLPETEGKTLEQIESIVDNHFNKCKTYEKDVTDA